MRKAQLRSPLFVIKPHTVQNCIPVLGVQSPYVVQSGGYGQTGRGATRPAQTSSAAALRTQQGQYATSGQGAVARTGPQGQRVATGPMVQNQGVRTQMVL